MNTINPFTPVSSEKSSNFFVAENERTKSFMDYVISGIEEGRGHTSIIGDYGQGKSRMLFYILNQYEQRPDLAFAFVSIKHVAGGLSGEKWEKGLFDAILNSIVIDLSKRYSTTRPEIHAIVNKLKTELVCDKRMESMKRAIDDYRSKGQEDMATDIEKSLDELVKYREMSPGVFFDIFLPALVKEFQSLGINTLFLLFDEMDHLYGEEKATALNQFVSKFRDDIQGVGVVISCATKIWMELSRHYQEFTPVYSPTVSGINIIQKYGYLDLKSVVEQNLKSVGREDNPFPDNILKVISTYNTTLRDMIRVVEEIYSELLKNPDADIDRIFSKMKSQYVDKKEIDKIVEGTIAVVWKNDARRDTGNNLVEIINELATNAKYYDASEEVIKKLMSAKLGSSSKVDHAFERWVTNGHLIRTGAGYKLNIAQVAKPHDIPFDLKLFAEKLYEEMDSSTAKIKKQKASQIFSQIAEKYKIDVERFDDRLDLMVEEGLIQLEGDDIRVLYMPPTGFLAQFVKDNNKNKKFTTNESIRVLLKEIFGLEELKGSPNGFSNELVVQTKGNSFMFSGRVEFVLPPEGIDGEKLRALLTERSRSNAFNYLIWPYKDYANLGTLINLKDVSDAEKFDDIKLLNLGLKKGALAADTMEKTRVLIVFPERKFVRDSKIRFFEYLNVHNAAKKNPQLATEVELLDKEIISGLPGQNLLAAGENILLNEFKKKVPINTDEVANLDQVIAQNVLLKIIRGDIVNTAEFDQKHLELLTKVYTFLILKKDHSGYAEIYCDPDEIVESGKNKVPSFVKRIMGLLKRKQSDEIELLIEVLKGDESYSLNEPNIRKRTKPYISAFSPIIEALIETYPDEIITSQDEKGKIYYSLADQGMSVDKIKQVIDFDLPSLECLSRDGFIGQGDCGKYLKEISDLRSILEGLPMDISAEKDRAKAFESYTFSQLKGQQAPLKERVIQVQDEVQKYVGPIFETLRGLQRSSMYPSSSSIRVESWLDRINKGLSEARKQGLLKIEGEVIDVQRLIPQIAESISEIRRTEENLSSEIVEFNHRLSELKQVIKAETTISQTDVLEFLKSEQPKKTLEEIKGLSGAKTSLGRLNDSLATKWLNLADVVKREFDKASQGIGELNPIRDRLRLESPYIKPFNSEQCMQNLRTLREQKKMLGEESCLEKELSELTIKTVQFQLELRRQKFELEEKIRDFVSRQSNNIRSNVDAYVQFIQKKGGDLASYDPASSFIQDREQMIRSGLYQKALDNLEEDANSIVTRETRLLQGKILEVVPEGDKETVREVIQAIEEGRIMRYLASQFERTSDYKERLGMLCELEELGVFKGRR